METNLIFCILIVQFLRIYYLQRLMNYTNCIYFNRVCIFNRLFNSYKTYDWTYYQQPYLNLRINLHKTSLLFRPLHLYFHLNDFVLTSETKTYKIWISKEYFFFYWAYFKNLYVFNELYCLHKKKCIMLLLKVSHPLLKIIHFITSHNPVT